jgi:predicted aldo/keto reductase-like oxidoreductase
MKRKDFLSFALASGLAASLPFSILRGSVMSRPSRKQVPRRPYKNQDTLSIIGFGGILCLGISPREASNLVAKAQDDGINYFDVAPSYGEGEAEEKLGPALKPYRSESFLACKTMRRDGDGARSELDRSLKRLRTDHFDLYQFHAVTGMKDVDDIFAPRGALETVAKARDEGLTRYIGFSAHSEKAALAMLDRFPFDSVLFPFNVGCWINGNFGPKVLEKAKSKGAARLALKAMAHSPWPGAGSHPYPKCWYRPIDDPELARLALRFTLSEDVTAALPPGEELLFHIATAYAPEFVPLSLKEREQLIQKFADVQPLFKT